MKGSDLGIIIIHWMMAVALLGAAASGLCLWDKDLRDLAAPIFVPTNVGVIHIGLSLAVAAMFLIHLWYLKHKNFLSHIAFQCRVVSKGRCLWRRVHVSLYWLLFTIVAIETVTGVLLTKLID